MIYYLDTNALYSIRKLPKDKLKLCYTSIMAILELISGANEVNFNKRRAILGMVFSFGVTIDHAFPEEIIANSFDIFDEYEFVEGRDKALFNLASAFIDAGDFNEFRTSRTAVSKLGYKYFKELDDNLSKNFGQAGIIGIKEFKKFEREPSPENIIKIGDDIFDLNTKEDMKKAFPLFSLAATIEAMCHIVLNLSRGNETVEEIFDSFNHLTEIYVKVFSKYCEVQMLDSKQPSKNDAMDLLHLLYLKNDWSRYIISDDKIFALYFPNNTLSLAKILD